MPEPEELPQQSEEQEGPRLPWRAERFLAFYLDLILLRVVFGAFILAADPGPALGLCAAALIFIGYHAGCVAAFGATAGKKLLGLRVYGSDGQPLPPKQAALRAAVGLLGLLPFSAGYVWGLLPGRRTWHDMAAGSQVWALKERGWLGKLAVYGGCAFILLALTASALYELARPEVDKARIVANARQSLDVLADLQERHKAANGAYAGDLERLLAVAPDPSGVAEALPMVFDGGRVDIALSGDGFTLSARARDPERTAVSVTRP